MSPEDLQEILDTLENLHGDNAIPKNIRFKIKEAMNILNDNQKNMDLRVDTSIEHLGELSDDPNLPSYSRTEIWGIVSQLESC